MTVIVLGLWALGLVALGWAVVLSRMLTARRESDQREVEDRWWSRVRVIEGWMPTVRLDDAAWLRWGYGPRWSDTLPGRWS